MNSRNVLTLLAILTLKESLYHQDEPMCPVSTTEIVLDHQNKQSTLTTRLSNTYTSCRPARKERTGYS